MTSPLLDDDKVRQQLGRLVADIGGPLCAIDTSTKLGSIALVPHALSFGDERQLDAMAMPCESLVQSLEGLFGHHGCAFKDLKALVIGIGPGSYTGLRVGLATAKGLGLGAGVPLYGVSSLLLEAQASGPGRVLVVRNALRGDVYAAVYDVASDGSVQVVLADMLVPLAELAACLPQKPQPARVIGDAASLVHQVVPSLHLALPQPPVRAVLGLIALSQRLRVGAADDLAELVPTYLRAGLNQPTATAAAK